MLKGPKMAKIIFKKEEKKRKNLLSQILRLSTMQQWLRTLVFVQRYTDAQWNRDPSMKTLIFGDR